MKNFKRISVLSAVVLTFVLMLSFTASAATKPKNPTGFQVVAVGADKVSLSWNKVFLADFYRIYVQKDGKWKKLRDIEARSCEISGLTASKSYTFAVRSVKQSGSQKLFSEKYSTLDVKTAAPPAPEVSGYAGVDYVKLRWEKSGGATGYSVYRKNGGKWEFIKKLSSDKLSCTVKELESNTSYQFSVRAFTSGDGEKVNGPRSAAFKIRTYKENKVTVKAAAGTATTVRLTWSKISDATGYRVYIYSGGEWKTVTTLNSRDSSGYTVKGLKSDSEYKFRVRAFRVSDGNTVWFVSGDSCTATTSPVKSDLRLYRTKNLKEALGGNAFTLTYKTESAKNGSIPVSVAKRGSKYRVHTKVDEMEYILIDTTKTDYILLPGRKAYISVSEAFSDTVNVKSSVESLLPGSKWKGSASLADFNGKKVVCETYVSPLKTRTVRYYYRAGTIVGIEEYNSKGELLERAVITSFKTSASASLFKVPDSYKKVK